MKSYQKNNTSWYWQSYNWERIFKLHESRRKISTKSQQNKSNDKNAVYSIKTRKNQHL